MFSEGMEKLKRCTHYCRLHRKCSKDTCFHSLLTRSKNIGLRVRAESLGFRFRIKGLAFDRQAKDCPLP